MKKLNELKTKQQVVDRINQIYYELNELKKQVDLLPSDSPENIQLSIEAFKRINEILDLE